MCPFFAVLIAYLAHSASALHICGNYCGPTWCNGMVLDESECDDSSDPETHDLTGPSCADVCCRGHDICCGHEDRESCNKEIVNCLGQCDPLSVTCTIGPVPVPAGTIWAAMDFVEDWCCGSPCPGDTKGWAAYHAKANTSTAVASNNATDSAASPVPL